MAPLNTEPTYSTPATRFGTCSWKYDSWRGIGYSGVPKPDYLAGQHADKLTDRVVVRLHGPDREAMDERSGKDWSRIVEARDSEIAALAGMLRDLRKPNRKTWVFVNNHYEGCAPLTIRRIQEKMQGG